MPFGSRGTPAGCDPRSSNCSTTPNTRHLNPRPPRLLFIRSPSGILHACCYVSAQPTLRRPPERRHLSRPALHIRIYRIRPRPRRMNDMRDSTTPAGPDDLSRPQSTVMQRPTVTTMSLKSTAMPTRLPAIYTADPNRPPVASYHNRLPVIVSPCERRCRQACRVPAALQLLRGRAPGRSCHRWSAS